MSVVMMLMVDFTCIWRGSDIKHSVLCAVMGVQIGDLPVKQVPLLTVYHPRAMNGKPIATEAAKLSPHLENKALSILDTKNPLDSPEFNVTEYINRLFPNEQSLSSVDSILEKLRRKTDEMGRQAETLTNSQSDLQNNGAEELQKAQIAIKELFQKIQDIKLKASQSEAMVQDITQDIKSLDYAKRHLTHSVTVLKRLQMLVTAVDQLEIMSRNRQYKESAQLLQAVIQLMQHFQSYKSVPQVAGLAERISKLQKQLESSVLREFEQGTDGSMIVQSQLLHDVCLVASVLGDTTKEKILKHYVDIQLANYRQIFRPSEEVHKLVSQLDNIARRYAFLKRLLKTCDEEHSEVFPSGWCSSARICEQFCTYVRSDLDRILSLEQPDVKELLKALQLTIEFEAQLTKRYEKYVKQDGEIQRPRFQFEKAISSCFQPYLWIYVEAEDRTLTNMIDSYVVSDKQAEDDGTMVVLPSSTDLFYFYRETLTQCAKFSTGKAFWDLCQVFAKHLYAYCNKVLLSGLTQNDKKAATVDHFRFASLALNTADYCCMTTSQLEEKLKEKIDQEYAERVDMQNVKDAFISAVSTGIDDIVRSLETSCDVYMQQMIRLQWGTMDTVGDQSDYVSQLQEVIKRYITVVGKTIANKRYFRTFADRFVDTFLTKYLLNIFKCKPISEIGAEQLLLDTHAIKTLLLDIALMGVEGSGGVSTPYINRVNRGISKVETILKTIMTPTDPAEGYIESYLFLIADKHTGNFTRLLDLKGIKKAEQSPLIEIFHRRAMQNNDLKDNSNLLPAEASSQSTASNLPNAITTSLSTIATSASNFNPNTLQQFGRSTLSPTLDSPSGSSRGRLNENFRKLVMTGMAFRKDLQERRENSANS
ncbi:Vacuolar protein sorting-associated protein 53 [Apophysomyces ossiformis]|uniref:Vacuolar protein sorting-associated protein 53 n=1 Tax=Apophysomyces ossiformis TaxID=679940 RepID=A0A8H7BQQ2_9FUNG|nr:Vacuolar protein sorting-associated protein 53 [Apophysomyces ossiformis]